MPRTIDDRALDAVRALWPAEQVRLLRSARLFLTDDGHGRADRLHGTIADAALPALDSDQVADEPGSGSATVKDRFNTIEGSSAPIADPVFTGTVTAPHVVATADLTAVDLIASGNSTLGNADADIALVQGHLKHKSAAPTIAVGAALGTGGSVGATIVGSDQAGYFDLVAGTAALTTGVLCTIAFAAARPSGTAYAVVVMPRNATAGVNAPQVFAFRDSAAAWSLRCNVAPGSGVALNYMYFVQEWTN